MKIKEYCINKSNIKRLIDNNEWCTATDKIIVEGCTINYFCREASMNPEDSGWRFFAGNEDEVYLNNLTNHNLYLLNTIANFSPEMLSLLDTASPCAFERVDGTNTFRRVE